MKCFLVIITVLVLFSCQKEHNLGEDYNKLIGTWGNINGDDSITITLGSKGTFEFRKSFNHNNRFKIKAIDKGNLDGMNFQSWILYGKMKKATKFYVNSSFDSIRIYPSDFIVDFHNSSGAYTLIKTQ